MSGRTSPAPPGPDEQAPPPPSPEDQNSLLQPFSTQPDAPPMATAALSSRVRDEDPPNHTQSPVSPSSDTSVFLVPPTLSPKEPPVMQATLESV